MPLTISDIIKLHDAGFTDDDIERFNAPATPSTPEHTAPIVVDVTAEPQKTPQEILSDMLK